MTPPTAIPDQLAVCATELYKLAALLGPENLLAMHVRAQADYLEYKARRWGE